MLESSKKIIENWEFLEVNGDNQFVSVDRGVIEQYAGKIRGTAKKVEHWHFPYAHPNDDFAFARFAVVTSPVNFCFSLLEEPGGKFTVTGTRGSFCGAMAMFHCFFRVFGEELMTVDKLIPQLSSLAETAQFFQGDNRIPLLEHRHWILREMIDVLWKDFQGDPWHIYEEADWDAVSLINLLIYRFPHSFGSDVSHLHTTIADRQRLEFPFFKKAKLVALLYQGRAMEAGSKLKTLRNMHEIVAIEDYRIPQFLHHVGILRYHQDLLDTIEQRQIIHPHSQMEIEIRAASTVANAIMLEELNRGIEIGHPDYWDIVPLDALEWFGGVNATLPHHLTPTTAY